MRQCRRRLGHCEAAEQVDNGGGKRRQCRRRRRRCNRHRPQQVCDGSEHRCCRRLRCSSGGGSSKSLCRSAEQICNNRAGLLRAVVEEVPLRRVVEQVPRRRRERRLDWWRRRRGGGGGAAAARGEGKHVSIRGRRRKPWPGRCRLLHLPLRLANIGIEGGTGPFGVSGATGRRHVPRARARRRLHELVHVVENLSACSCSCGRCLLRSGHRGAETELRGLRRGLEMRLPILVASIFACAAGLRTLLRIAPRGGCRRRRGGGGREAAQPAREACKGTGQLVAATTRQPRQRTLGVLKLAGNILARGHLLPSGCRRLAALLLSLLQSRARAVDHCVHVQAAHATRPAAAAAEADGWSERQGPARATSLRRPIRCLLVRPHRR
mmetsp:Transcript_79374/g.202153  ORF Transcript_79374/g.202153 Transcript_79374/m.202153 type:complete len:381 (-) Transcript_79374:548-1690(-)